MHLRYPFTEAEFETASRVWGCNCGPVALAFACQVDLEQARRAIPGFDAKRYTSPWMMKVALDALNRQYDDVIAGGGNLGNAFGESPSLVRLQWCGPWTEPDANRKWSYRFTHWAVTYYDDGFSLVFDVNGGIMTFGEWAERIVPALTASFRTSDKRCAGNYYPTHIWRLRPC